MELSTIFADERDCHTTNNALVDDEQQLAEKIDVRAPFRNLISAKGFRRNILTTGMEWSRRKCQTRKKNASQLFTH
jgi:hypothetical protein